jgi:uncharacterized protein
LPQKRQSSLVVIKGCRRIGKNRLTAEYAKDKIFLLFTGITPEADTTAQTQPDNFARQLSKHFSLLPMTFTDWTDAFNHLSSHLNDKPTVIPADGISSLPGFGAREASKIVTY